MSHFEQHVERIIQHWLRQQRVIQMYKLTEANEIQLNEILENSKVLCHVQRPLPKRKKNRWLI